MKIKIDNLRKELAETHPDLEILDERYIELQNGLKKRHEFLVLNKITGCTFWSQRGHLISRNYRYNIFRYNISNVKSEVQRLTNGEYEVLSDSCKTCHDEILILHKTCGTTAYYRSGRFINEGARCKKCLYDSMRITSEKYMSIIEGYGNFKLNTAYYNNKTPVEILCLDCNKTFIRTPNEISAQIKKYSVLTCPNCRKLGSIGENFVNDILSSIGISFKREYSDPNCKKDRLLKFDFAIFSDGKLSAFIEFDGKQHRNKKSMFSKEEFDKIVERDIVKNEFAKDNNIPMLRLENPNKDDIAVKIKSFLREYKII